MLTNQYYIYDNVLEKIACASFNAKPITDQTLAAQICVRMCTEVNDFRRFDVKILQPAK